MANKVGFGITELNLIGSSGTPKIDSPNNLNINAVNVAISTNATVGGNLDVDGHTELDDVNVSGISTFAGITTVTGETLFTKQLNVSGVSTFAGDINFPDMGKAVFGTGGDFEIFHSGNGSFIKDGGVGPLTLLTNSLIIRNAANNEEMIEAGENSSVNLFFDDTKRFETASTGAVVTGILTATSDVKVGSGVTISSSGDIFNTGITTNAKQIVGLATNNVIPFLYNNYSDLPSATTYHGAFAHVHGAGKAYFAHAAAWYELVHVDNASHTVGLGTEKYNVGILTATSIKVGTGVTVSSDGDSFVTGISTATKFVGDLSDSVTGRWLLGANGTNHYTFTGPGGLSSADDPTIYLARGQTYEFNNQSGGNHPFHIQTSSGAYNESNLYTTGVTNPGASTGVIKFAVPFSAPNTLYYVCQNHSNMAGTIVVYPSI